jgi:hypothetical protein
MQYLKFVTDTSDLRAGRSKKFNCLEKQMTILKQTSISKKKKLALKKSFSLRITINVELGQPMNVTHVLVSFQYL